MLVRVALSYNIFDPLTYGYTGDPTLIPPGRRVIVPLGRNLVSGWVVDKNPDYKGRVKNIIGLIQDGYVPGSRFVDFAAAVAETYFVSRGLIFDGSLPPCLKSLKNLFFEDPSSPGEMGKMEKYSLSQLQQIAKTGPIEFFYKNNRHQPSPDNSILSPGCDKDDQRFLLSYDRKDAYRGIITEQLGRGKSVLIITPDNLSADYWNRNIDGVEVYHSGIKAKEKDDLWQRFYCGQPGVVAGGLSSVFLPIANLGTVICDRAGSGLYKANRFSKFNVNTLAQFRAHAESVPFVEGFSSPTVNSFGNRENVAFQENRVKEIAPVDVRMLTGKDKGIPSSLIELIKSHFLENKKILIVLNRRDSDNFLFCVKCKKIQKCTACSGLLKVDSHFNGRCLRCGLKKDEFSQCPTCGEALSLIEDISVTSLVKQISKEITEEGVVAPTAEDIKNVDGLLDKIVEGKIAVSTPVIVNPFFKKLFDTIIYVRPESLFSMNEYHAAEMIFSLVSELKEMVKEKGEVVVFSNFHFHYALRMIDDEGGFLQRELQYREWFLLPPFANVYQIEVKGSDLRKVGKEMRELYLNFKNELGIKRVYLDSRKKIRGNYKGVLEAHAQSEVIRTSGLLSKRNLSVELVMI